MKITDPDGQWLVAVHPTGTVTELADAPEKPKRPRRQKVTVPTAAVPAIVRAPASVPAPAAADVTAPVDAPARHTTPSPVATSPDLAWALDHTRVSRRGELAASFAPTAVLSFSTGDVARVVGAALIGRRPSPAPARTST